MQTDVIHAVAPTRICDVGGWTDTHFAGHGTVFNIAVYPYVEVQIQYRSAETPANRIVVSAENFGDSYAMDPARLPAGKHPLIEAAIRVMNVPSGLALNINIFSYAPPGASMGTSAAVSVALIGALDALTPGRLTPHEVAALAHSIETRELGLECGIQDQLSSAYGGIGFIQMHRFPHAVVSPIQIPNEVWWELEQRLVLAYIGTPHQSSSIHKMVISALGNSAEQDSRIERLRRLAHRTKDALYAGDFAAMGGFFDENTQVQRELHPKLVCEAFEDIISTARDLHALGCKVNGAGGDGGSISILTAGDMSQKRALQNALISKGFKVLPIYLSRQGLRVWKTVTKGSPA